MTTDQIILFTLFGTVFGLLLWGRFRYDIVAFGALMAGVVLGVVPTENAFDGFGHPATLIVALGIGDPDELARQDPQELWDKVAPFVITNQGKRIIRNGKTPDADEVTEWIHWAGAARALDAA